MYVWVWKECFIVLYVCLHEKVAIVHVSVGLKGDKIWASPKFTERYVEACEYARLVWLGNPNLTLTETWLEMYKHEYEHKSVHVQFVWGLKF